jgi:ligand-binding sensor domain-containing protein/signal transduction histidine kinase
LHLGTFRALVVAINVAALVCVLWVSESRAERLPIKTYTTADGLPHDHINRIVQDSKGFIWFCTGEGLSRFDGYRFTTYGTDQGLAGLQVTDFLETRDGTYWAATTSGLCRFITDALPRESTKAGGAPPLQFIVYYPGESARAKSVNSIYEDHRGAIWCCTDEGLYRADRVSGNTVFSFVGIIEPAARTDVPLRIEAVIEDRHSSLWIIGASGLYRMLSDGTVERYTSEEGLPEGFSHQLLEDRDGRIWVTSDFGLYQLVPDPKPHRLIVARHYTVKEGLESNGVLSSCQTRDGTLWVSTVSGLSALLPGPGGPGDTLRTYLGANGLIGSLITSIYEDRDRNLWLGTDSGGLMRLAATGFVTYDERDLPGRPRVASIFEDRAGELCVINTNGFISKFDGRAFHAVRPSLPKAITYWGWGWYQTMCQDSGGEWWLGTGEGLIRYPKIGSLDQLPGVRPIAVYKARDGLPTNEIFRIFEDSRRGMWISTLGDPNGVLTRWDRATQTFHRYSQADGIPASAPTAFGEDSDGNVWIGLYVGGLLRYRAGCFTLFTSSDGLPAGMIRCLYFDHAGRLWVATAKGGVARVDQPSAEHPSFVSYSAADGLSSNEANCVNEDQWGRIYIGTGRGLDELNPATGHVNHYTTADGLANSFVNVSFRGKDGSLWFGTLQGLSRLIPEPERPAIQPTVLVTGLRIASIPYPIPELGATNIAGPELGASQNNVQVEFTGLSLAPGESLRYQYKLEGASSDWSAPTDQRVVSYPNLAPGAYRFSVRAIGSSGTMSEIPAELSFSIAPPVWRRWWFISMTAALAVLAAYALYRYRVGRLLEIERVRTRIASDLHDDLGANLTRIGILSEVAHSELRAKQPGASSPLGSIAEISRECVASMGDIVWAIDPARDYLIDLVQRMRRFAGEVFSNGKIDFELRAPSGEQDLALGPDLRRDVFLIFKEAVSNAARHSRCTNVDIELTLEGSRLVLRITDNGRGFDPSGASEGQGLASMKRRAAGLGGDLRLVSTQGEGTQIILMVPRKTR